MCIFMNDRIIFVIQGKLFNREDWKYGPIINIFQMTREWRSESVLHKLKILWWDRGWIKLKIELSCLCESSSLNIEVLIASSLTIIPYLSLHIGARKLITIYDIGTSYPMYFSNPVFYLRNFFFLMILINLYLLRKLYHKHTTLVNALNYFSEISKQKEIPSSYLPSLNRRNLDNHQLQQYLMSYLDMALYKLCL